MKLTVNIRSTALRPIIGFLVWMISGCTSPAPNNPRDLLDSGGLTADLAAALELLIDRTATAPDRRVAVRALLNKANRDTDRMLVMVLEDPSYPRARQAIMEVIVQRSQVPPRSLSDPIVALLVHGDESFQARVAQALGRFDDPQLVRQLAQIAGDLQLSLWHRSGAIKALGHQSTQESARQLMDLIAPDRSERIQLAAFASLATLTGLEDHGEDRALWRQWWIEARIWNPARWHEQMRRNLDRHHASRDILHEETVRRMLDLYKASYRTAAAVDKSGVLVSMLSDSLLSVRQLAVELATDLLLGGEPFDEPLRVALRSRLDDRSSKLREAATLLLYQLPDEAAADLVAGRLKMNQEHVTRVLGADLLMMQRMPRQVATPATLVLLASPQLRPKAAGALAEMAKRDMLDVRQLQEAGRIVRKHLIHQLFPSPQEVRLLGMVGNNQDWQRIADWVDSENRAVKEAAARVWAESDRSLKLLAKRLGDPIIEPIAVAAARRRGMDPWTLLELARHSPTQPQIHELWCEAIVAMSRRVVPEAVFESVLELRAAGAAPKLLDEIITAALDRGEAKLIPEKVRFALYLTRGEVRFSLDNATAALADFQQLEAAEDSLTREVMDQLQRSLVRAYIELNQIDEAFASAHAVLELHTHNGVRPTRDRVINQMLELCQRYVDSERTNDAALVLQKTRLLIGPAIPPSLSGRIHMLDTKIIALRNLPDLPPAESDKGTASPPKTPRLPR